MDQPCASLAEHDCLPLLLQHSCINQDVKLICSLLCVCKSLRVSIGQQCRCQLALELNKEGAEALSQVADFANFLKHWAGLAKTLELNWNRISLQDVEGLLRNALIAAAAPPTAADTETAAPAADGVNISTGPLRISSLKANVAGPLLLGQLPAATLTCLELGHAVDYAGLETVAVALARLTGLQDLTVLSASSQLLLPATSALTGLTRACLLLRDLAHNAHKLQHLPPQLRKLEVTVGWAAAAAASSSGGSRPALPLGHLTGLLELRGSGYFALQALDQLPAGLASLQVPDCPVAQPLLHLTALTTLNMYNSTSPAEQLAKVSAALSKLKEVSLGYFGAEDSPNVDAAAPGWPGLPLRALDFDSNSGEFRLGTPSLDALGRLGSCLTQLALSGGVLVEATPTDLSQVLSRLTRLHTLRLASVELLSEPPLTAVTTSTHVQQAANTAQSQQHAGASTSEITGVAAAEAPAAAAAAGAAAAAAGLLDVPGVAPDASLTAAAAAAAAAGGGGAGASSGGVSSAVRSRRNTRSSGTRLEFLGAAYRVMAAVAGLQSLRSLKLSGLTGWLINPAAELQPLRSATQLTCLHVMDMDVSDDVIRELVQGLTQLRELDMSDNASIGDGALAYIGVCLPLLRHLDVSGCVSVSEGGIKALKQVLPAVDVVCFQSSEEEWL